MAGETQSDNDDRRVVLALDDATSRGGGENAVHMQNLSAQIRVGEMVEVELDRLHDPRDLASTIVGIKELISGTLRFFGENWLGHDYARHFRMRSEIGRVFADSAWIQNLTLRDNLKLPLLHHGLERAEADARIEDWLGRLAGSQHGSVTRVLDHRSASVEPSILQLCQLVRAMCNQPKMLILERPLRYLATQCYEKFADAINELRGQGTAVLLFAGERDGHDFQWQGPLQHWKTVGSKIINRGGQGE